MHGIKLYCNYKISKHDSLSNNNDLRYNQFLQRGKASKAVMGFTKLGERKYA